jgi:tryptophan-rich sensory protein
MVLNFAWSPIFFAGHDITLAKYVIIAMIVIAAAAALLFYRLRPVAGLLMVPYLCWLMFATALNTSIEALNPGGGVALFQP